jgi:EpsI family protein
MRLTPATPEQTQPARRATLRWLAVMLCTSLLAVWGRPQPAAGKQDRLDLEHLFAKQFGAWRLDEINGAFVRPTKTLTYRMYDQVLERTYVNNAGQRVMLSVAFGSEQSSSLQLHRPEICYRANGFEVREVVPGTTQAAGQKWAVTRLVATMPDRSEPVTYWTVLGGEVVQDAQSFRWRQWHFALRRELIDGLLVRVSSIEPPTPAAFALHDAFIAAIVKAMAPTQRDQVIGRLPPAAKAAVL